MKYGDGDARGVTKHQKDIITFNNDDGKDDDSINSLSNDKNGININNNKTEVNCCIEEISHAMIMLVMMILMMMNLY